MKHFVRFEFGNRIRLCNKMMSEIDDTTDDINEVTCKRCLKILREESKDD